MSDKNLLYVTQNAGEHRSVIAPTTGGQIIGVLRRIMAAQPARYRAASLVGGGFGRVGTSISLAAGRVRTGKGAGGSR